ncbi:MAG: M20/M25/M40 family metallo-hydrolase [Capnocytophaga sp.]|nr:M20/M25/M40 family metallo-hydrolase [Capnocytophaga sp.]
MSSITREVAEAHVYFLSDDLLEGRESGMRGSRIARNYIVAQLRQYGVLPLLDDGYLQHFEAYRVDNQSKENKRYTVNDSLAAIISKRTHYRLSMANVLGVIYGENPNEWVVIGAHYDHLGTDPYLHGDTIYNGADDNASGVSAVLQLAKAFSLESQKPRRNIIFAFWDGEERGLLGSEYFVSHCDFLPQITTYLNYDMIGRNNRAEEPEYLVYFYTASYPDFGLWLKDDIKTYALALQPDYRPWDNPIGGSDNSSFAKYGIPIIWYHTDGHADYHQPTDHADRLNWAKLTDITKASFLAARRLANDEIQK